MQNRRYKNLLYFICSVILITLTIQVYWNHKNLKAGKQQLLNEIQASIDNAIDSYFVDKARKEANSYSAIRDSQIIKNPKLDILLNEKFVAPKMNNEVDLTYKDSIIEVDSEIRRVDTIFKTRQLSNVAEAQEEILQFFDGIDMDSIINLHNLTSKIVVSITADSVDTSKLGSYIRQELARKNIERPFGFILTTQDGKTQTFNMEGIDDFIPYTLANSPYLPKNSRFQLFFTNSDIIVLKKNIVGLILSAMLIASVIACLFYLLIIINRQKQLAEIKNDLISNITHEFKTPISTAKVALEGIQKFNKNNDPVKTRNYLQVSNAQLDKLQLMVEKLLETASIDGDNLQFKKEKVHLVIMLSELIEKHRNLASTKKFIFSLEEREIPVIADAFHLENALNNILDNAVKYGGNKIKVSVSSINEVVKIGISDNGGNLTKHQAEQVFDKFYRVPKGNTHDVKGFGIGLYYSKNIIEKHGGNIEILLNNQTNFIITIPFNG